MVRGPGKDKSEEVPRRTPQPREGASTVVSYVCPSSALPSTCPEAPSRNPRVCVLRDTAECHGFAAAHFLRKLFLVLDGTGDRHGNRRKVSQQAGRVWMRWAAWVGAPWQESRTPGVCPTATACCAQSRTRHPGGATESLLKEHRYTEGYAESSLHSFY